MDGVGVKLCYTHGIPIPARLSYRYPHRVLLKITFFARAVCEQGMFHENLLQCLILIRTLESFPCIDEYQLQENIYALLILLAE